MRRSVAIGQSGAPTDPTLAATAVLHNCGVTRQGDVDHPDDGRGDVAEGEEQPGVCMGRR